MKLLSSIPEYEHTVLYFLKFSDSKENLEKLQKGMLYMNNLKYYIDLEKATRYKGRGDILEATAVMNDLTDVKLISQKTGEIIPIGNVLRMTLRRDDCIYQPVFCTAAISSGILEIIKENDKQIEVKALFTDEQKERFPKDFGKYVLVIRAVDFVKRIQERFREKKISYIASFIKYVDFSKNHIEQLNAFKDGALDIFFWKDISLAYQIEHRMVILNPDLKTPFIFDLGDLSGFCKLISAEEFFNEEMLITINKD
ncbi:hypothetical protein EDM57_01850 [Brevibacillus gelatini]|uniref:Uncharacterized protein n=2 Tax=Brevibacillus gelatini TaxID=1655277 RepID=A0A3M8BCH5_9BACL|nr:hypothetical protein EDM57_01850 [Brevibacillus gelatini]